jgi:hypothetical protein
MSSLFKQSVMINLFFKIGVLCTAHTELGVLVCTWNIFDYSRLKLTLSRLISELSTKLRWQRESPNAMPMNVRGRSEVVGRVHRYITSRSNMSISADVHPWGDFSLLTAPPPTTSGVKSHYELLSSPPLLLSHFLFPFSHISLYLPAHPSLPE